MKRMEKMNLSALEREQLLSATRSQTVRAADARRARLILMLDNGETREAIMQRLRCALRNSPTRGVLWLLTLSQMTWISLRLG